MPSLQFLAHLIQEMPHVALSVTQLVVAQLHVIQIVKAMNKKIIIILLSFVILIALGILGYLYMVKVTFEKNVLTQVEVKKAVNSYFSNSVSFEKAIKDLEFNPQLADAIRTEPGFNSEHKAVGIPVEYPDYKGKNDAQVEQLFKDYLIAYVDGSRRYRNITYSVTYVLGALDNIVQWGTTKYLTIEDIPTWQLAYKEGKLLARQYLNFLEGEENAAMTDYLDLYFNQKNYLLMDEEKTTDKKPIPEVPYIRM